MKDLKTRTRDFAIRIIRLYGCLPQRAEAWVMGKQLLRCGTSVEHIMARECAPGLMPSLLASLRLALQELEETGYWLELLGASGIVSSARLADLVQEANELTAILVTCVKAATSKRTRERDQGDG